MPVNQENLHGVTIIIILQMVLNTANYTIGMH